MFQTGDILFRSTANFNDYIAGHTIGLDSGHTSLILCGSELSSVSAKGISPSNTYVTVYPSRLWTIEYFLDKHWKSPITTSIIHLKRVSGPEISGKEALGAWNKTIDRPRNYHQSVQRHIKSYFKMNYDLDRSWLNTCSEWIMLILKETLSCLTKCCDFEYSSS